jgi:phosphatidylglycerol---prolipoprotein diacylglyceryl transferase
VGTYFYWNPSKEIFILPFVNWPILWYSLFFAVGFIVGIFIFNYLLKRYLLNYPHFSNDDISHSDLLLKILKSPQNRQMGAISKKILNSIKDKEEKDLTNLEKFLVIRTFNNFIDDDSIKKLDGDIKFDKSQFIQPLRSKKRLFLEKMCYPCVITINHLSSLITDKFAICMLLATIVGARLGHLLFYEDFANYLSNPLEILKIWEGGLASHGAAVAIIIMVFLFSMYLQKKSHPISWLNLLDLVAVPTAFAAIFIRIGNFFNQEIVGIKSLLPWAIIFGNPADGSLVIPRHPVQLYEALFYALVFVILLYLSRKPKFFLKGGKLIGLFLFMIFSFRFFIEFYKVKQSVLLGHHSIILMGQYLSIPFIVLGIVLFYFDESKQKIKSLKDS